MSQIFILAHHSPSFGYVLDAYIIMSVSDFMSTWCCAPVFYRSDLRRGHLKKDRKGQRKRRLNHLFQNIQHQT